MKKTSSGLGTNASFDMIVALNLQIILCQNHRRLQKG
jgi:hypothetical protein